MKTLKLADGRIVKWSDYVFSKTKDLIEFGYSNLTENEVDSQLQLIVSGENPTTIIGHFCKSDIYYPQPTEDEA